MNDKQFDPLDERFRQAAEQFEPPYDPEDWKAMERLLDGKKKKKRPFAFWWITDVMMLGMLSLFMVQVSNDRNDSITGTNPARNTGSIEKVSAGLNPAIQSPGNQATILAPNVTTDENEVAGAMKRQTGGNDTENSFRNQPVTGLRKIAIISKNNQVKASGPAPATTGEQQAIFPESGKNISPAQEKISGKEAEARVSSTATIPFDSATGSNANLPADSGSRHTGTLPASALEKNQEIPQTITDTMASKGRNTDSTETKMVGLPLQVKKGHFFITGIYGQEKSGVKESSPGPWGSIYGGMIGYQLNKKISIKAGLLVTDKNYAGGSGVYKIPPGSYYREITDFKAICNILEIPLLVSYQFIQGKKSSWVVTAGPVSSIMQSEEYHYHYRNNSGGTGYGKKYYNTGDVEFFSGLRISPSYERFLGKRYSIAAEPFIQLPLSGIGEGSVKLLSFGFQLTTSIHLSPLNKK